MPSPVLSRPSCKAPASGAKSMRPRILTILAMLSVAVGLGLFIWRGITRGVVLSLDFTMIYAASRAWGQGVDAYAFTPLYDLFLAAGGTGKTRDPNQFVSLYPPSTYALLSPFGLLRWPVAKMVWLATNVTLVVVTIGLLWRQRPCQWDGGSRGKGPVWIGLFMVAVWLAWAPLHTGLSMGQLSLATTVLMLPVALARCDEAKGEELRLFWNTPAVVIAGFLLGLAGLLKPQLTIYIGLAVLLTRYRAAFGWAVITGILGMGLAAGRLQWATPGWWMVWQNNVQGFTSGSIGRPHPDNPQFHEMMHLETVMGLVLPPELEKYIVAIATATPALLFLMVLLRLLWVRGLQPLDAQGHRALMALAACLTLITGYHRSYDATLLLLGVIWLAHALTLRAGFGRFFVLAAASLFLAPTPSFLVALTRRGYLPESLQVNLLWQATALQAHTWAVLVWAGVLVVELWHAPCVEGLGSPS